MLTTWIIQLTGLVILSVVADIMLPEGRTNKIIKCMFSFVCMFVIIQPIFWIKNGSIDVSSILSGNSEHYVNEELKEAVSGLKLDELKRTCNSELKKLGYDVQTEIIGTYFDKISVEKIYIKCKNTVILENESHILEIKETVSGLFNIDKGNVFVYG